MIKGKVTFVFFIENEYQEGLLLSNHALQESNIFVVYSQFSPQNYKGKFLNTESVNFEQALGDILKEIETEWCIYLKPEEKIPLIVNLKYYAQPYLFAKVKTIIPDSDDYFLGYELRIFNVKKLLSENFQIISEDESASEIVIENYAENFPELDKLKLKKYTELYKNGDKRLSVILYLSRKNFFSTEYLLSFISKFSEEESKSAESLGIQNEIVRILFKEYGKDIIKYPSYENILLKAYENFNNSPSINYLLGELYFKRKDYDNALKYFRNCVNFGDKKSFYKYLPFQYSLITYPSYYYLGKIYLKLNETEKARTAFEYCLEYKPKFNEVVNLLHKTEVKLNQKNELNFLCQSCGNCCRYEYVNVTFYDIKRILENRPDLKINDFIRIIPVFKELLDFCTDEAFISENGIKKWMTLKKKADSKDCIFLTDNSMCSIHEFKPLVCRTWPFSLRKFDKKIIWAKDNRDFIKEGCKHIMVDNAISTEELKFTLENSREESNKYLQAISKWNEMADVKEPTDSGFINFMIKNL